MGDVPEQTAERLLANDALLDRLRTITDEGVFVEEIESAIIHENAQLLEEKAAKEVELARKNAELELVRDQLREHKSTLDSVEQQTTELRDRLEASSIELHNTKSAAASESERIRSLAEEVKKLRSRAAELEVERKQEASEKRAVARQAHYVRIGLAALSAVVLTAVFLGVVHLAPWGALQNHPNGTAIQAAACVALVLGVIGLLFPATRKWTWSVSGLGVGGLIVLILSKL